MPRTRKISLSLTEDEVLVLRYIMGITDSRFSDPLKDIYEAGQRAREKDFHAYDVQDTLAQKVFKACADECSTCHKSYDKYDPMCFCSNGFHCCRNCEWSEGRVVKSCEYCKERWDREV